MSSPIFRNPKAAQIGRRIASFLADRALTQTAFALRLGVKPGHVSDWVRGRHAPSHATLIFISREFGLNEKWLTEGIGPICKEGQVAEAPEPYGKLDPEGRAIIKEIESLWREASPELKRHLKGQLKILKEWQKTRTRRAAGED